MCFLAASNAGLFPAVGSARAGVAVTAGIYSGTSVWSKSGGGGPAELGCCSLTLSGCPPATGLVRDSLVRHDHWEMSIDAQVLLSLNSIAAGVRGSNNNNEESEM